jgi:small multidrug resistance family-3 protein
VISETAAIYAILGLLSLSGYHVSACSIELGVGGASGVKVNAGAQNIFFFVLTAVAEIVGCYLPYLWLRKSGSPWLLIPAAISLSIFAWLLTLHPAAAGRVYAAYGGVYIAAALLWLWRVDGTPLTRWDLTGVAVAMIGMGIIVWGGWNA